MNKRIVVLVLFLLISVAELFSEFIHHRELMFFTKPLLMPLLVAFYAISVGGKWNAVHKTMMVALFFAWVGGMALMFTPESATDTHLMGIPKHKNLFLLGLGSYLVTQLLYIRVYKRAVNDPGATLLHRFWSVPFIAYWALMLLITIPAVYTNPEKSMATIPVIIYASILMSMGVFALYRFGRTSNTSFRLVLLGACLFIISDSLIAINFLVLPEPSKWAGFSIMLTYIPAEFLIALGVLKHYNADNIT
jgi:uncharacterized membrane protein YhhN